MRNGLPSILLFCLGVFIALNAIVKTVVNTINSHSHECKKEELKMSTLLVPYFEQFITDCEKYGIEYDHTYCLKHFHIDHSYFFQGTTDFYHNEISINENLEGDSIGMRFVVYHEFGHWLGLEHSEGIMQPSYSTKVDRAWAEENWEELKTVYFNKLKTIDKFTL